MTDVSIVLPVFNGARTLERSIISAARQSVAGIEVIVVDDGSSDESLEIARECEKDGLCSVLAIEHGGAGAARNAGMEVASGEYLTFLDADDALVPNACEVLLRTAREYDADIVYGHHLYVTKEGLTEPVLYLSWARAYGNGENLRLAERHACDHPVVTGKLIRNDLIRETQLRFTNVTVAEDYEFSFRGWHRADKVVAAPRDVYLRRPFERLPGKTDAPVTPETLADRYLVHSLVDAYCATHGLVIARETNRTIGLRQLLTMVASMGELDSRRDGLAEFCERAEQELPHTDEQRATLGIVVHELRKMRPEDLTLARALYWSVRADLA